MSMPPRSGSFWSDESAQGLVEYVLIIGLVAVGLMLIIVAFRDAIGRFFGTVSDSLDYVTSSEAGGDGGQRSPGCGQKGKSHNCF
jgi:Flp pilus assembly pilin Flp